MQELQLGSQLTFMKSQRVLMLRAMHKIGTVSWTFNARRNIEVTWRTKAAQCPIPASKELGLPLLKERAYRRHRVFLQEQTTGFGPVKSSDDSSQARRNPRHENSQMPQ